jgi:hypothetical protein
LHYYTIIRGDIIQNAICYLGLQQYNFTVHKGIFFILYFYNLYHHHCHFQFWSGCSWYLTSAFVRWYINFLLTILVLFFHDYACADYAVLCGILSSYDWSGMCKQFSVDSAVNHFNSVVTDSLNKAIHCVCSRRSKFPCCFFFFNFKHYIYKTNLFFII